MAYTLDPLITLLDETLNPTDQQHWIHENHKEPLKSLLEKVKSLRITLEGTSCLKRSNNKMIESIQIEIRDAAHEAEDIIESHNVTQMLLSEPSDSRFLISPPDQLMSKVFQKFDDANEKLMAIINEEDTANVSNPPLSDADAVISPDPTSSKNETAVVGFDDDTLRLKDRLTSGRGKLEIIPIVGMGGIGKTTLARNLYSDSLIVYHFHALAWVTVSQDYSVRALLLGLLRCLFGKISDEMLRADDANLGLILYQSLYGKRYLIVLDDVWSEKAWDDIKPYFPNQSNRSRILITSRELDVAKYPDSACEEHQMRLLSSAQSWDLLRLKVFGQEVEEEARCPFEEIGRKIVSDCGGLPLAISVIGGVLSVDRASKDLWEKVAKDVRSVVSSKDEHFSKILTLSYDRLPLHLKPCFLYMSAFPEDFSVGGSKLVKLWIAEGFVRRSNADKDKTLEDFGHEYLKALVDRNLFSVSHTKNNGRADCYTMHDILRDLCVKKADKDKFLRVVKNESVSEEFRFSRRASIHCPHYDHTKSSSALSEYISLSRSLLFVNGNYETSEMLSPMFFALRLLRVLDAHDIRFGEFPTEVTQLVNLRFLAFTCEDVLSAEISRLRNLQTLIVRFIYPQESVFPHEAWEIPGLRHIKMKYSHIFITDKVLRVYERLQTIYNVDLRGLLASSLLGSIPNVKKLGIVAYGFDEEDVDVIDLSRLGKLETLRLFHFANMDRNNVLSLLRLPHLLKDVYLSLCTIPTRFMEALGSLQHVEVLRIRNCQFESPEWETNEEEDDLSFCSLRYLLIEYSNLVSWRAHEHDFPRLRHLVVGQCDALEEIPTHIGDTLETIELDESNAYLVDWAEEVREAQFDSGNESLRISFFPKRVFPTIRMTRKS